jgi:hypothetical protein
VTGPAQLSSKGSRWSRAGLWALAGCALLAPLPLLDTFFLDLSAGDEGVLLMAAHRVAHGQVPYRDFFSMLLPGVQLLLASMFSLFGESLLTARLLFFAGNAVLIVGLWALLHELPVSRAGQAAALAFLIPLGGAYWPILSHHWLCTATTVASAACLAAAHGGRRPRFVVAAGLAAGAGVLFLQDGGTAWLVLGLAPLLLETPGTRMRSMATYLLAAAAVLAPVVLYLGMKGALPSLWADTVRFPLTIYHLNPGNRVHWGQGWWAPVGFGGGPAAGWDSAVLSLQQLGINGAHLLLLFLYPAALLVLGWALVKAKRGETDRTVVALLWALFGASVLAAVHRPTILMLAFGAAGPLAALVWGLDRAWGERKVLRAAFAGAAMALVALAGLTLGLPGAILSSERFVFPAGAVRTYAPGDRAALDLLRSFGGERLKPGERIFCYSYGSGFYFLLGQDDETRFDNFDMSRDDPAHVKELLRELSADPPEWILLDGRYQDRASDPILEWIRPKYSLVAKSPRLVIAKRANR